MQAVHYNSPRRQAPCALGLAAVLLAGCAMITSENINDATDFQSDHVQLAVRGNYRTLAVLPFENQTDFPSATQYARQAFFGSMAAYKSYALQTLDETDARLASLPRSAVDPAQYQKLRTALGVDLLAFGYVIEQEHSYGVVYGRNAVRVKILLVDAATGATVWQSEEGRSRTLLGMSFMSMFDNEYMWGREIMNRYNELFRDMIVTLPDRSAKALVQPQETQ
jgi:hypothetical protein